MADAYTRRWAVVKEACTMAVDYLMKTEFSGVKTAPELAQLTGMSETNSRLVLSRQSIMMQDLAHLCDSRGVEMGITLRFPHGQEVTFTPGNNFGSGPPSTAKPASVPPKTKEKVTVK